MSSKCETLGCKLIYFSLLPASREIITPGRHYWFTRVLRNTRLVIIDVRVLLRGNLFSLSLSIYLENFSSHFDLSRFDISVLSLLLRTCKYVDEISWLPFKGAFKICSRGAVGDHRRLTRRRLCIKRSLHVARIKLKAKYICTWLKQNFIETQLK